MILYVKFTSINHFHNYMGKNALEKESATPSRIVSAMSIDKLRMLMDAMEELYGEEGRDMTLAEVARRHPDLVAKLDGEDVEAVLGVALSTEQVYKMDRVIEIGTTVRDARKKVFGPEKKKV